MKTKVLFNSWSIIFSLLFVCCFLIETSAQTQYGIQIRKYRIITLQSDTVNIDNKDILIEYSPMLFFPDYKKLFNVTTEVTIFIHGNERQKGYSVNFIVKDSILYLKRVTIKGNDFVRYKADKKDITHIFPKNVSKEEIKARAEKMTARKFDKNGLLKADWVSGIFYGGVDGKFIKLAGSLSYSTDTFYKVVFEKGVLKEVTMFKDKRPEQYLSGE